MLVARGDRLLSLLGNANSANVGPDVWKNLELWPLGVDTFPTGFDLTVGIASLLAFACLGVEFTGGPGVRFMLDLEDVDGNGSFSSFSRYCVW